jgi:hypothetical protein
VYLREWQEVQKVLWQRWRLTRQSTGPAFGRPVIGNVDMAYLCQEATPIPLRLYRCQSNPLPDGERDGAFDATREGCATVVHADIRGLDTSRQIYVAGLPSL